MIITREMFEWATPEQINQWHTIARWYYFTFEVRGSPGCYAEGQHFKWLQMNRQFMNWETYYGKYRRYATPEFLEWCSRAVTIWIAAGEPPTLVGGNKPKE